jgi:hypothetical protein
MVEEAGFFGVGGGVYFPVFVGEDGDETAVSRVKIQMTFFFAVQVGLFENEGHSQNAFPEVYGRLASGADDGDVVNALSGDFFDDVTSEGDRLVGFIG